MFVNVHNNKNLRTHFSVGLNKVLPKQNQSWRNGKNRDEFHSWGRSSYR